MKSGFRKTGIFPLNKQEVLGRLPNPDPADLTDVGTSFIDHMKELCGCSAKKKRVEVTPGKSVSAEEVHGAAYFKEEEKGQS